MSISLKEIKVLYVEDDFINRKLALTVLNRLGITKIDIAENGKDAVELYAEKKYDLVLMDIQMPEMDGFEATSHIRKIDRENNTYTPVIALTAFLFNDDEIKYHESGLDHYIYKPFDPEELSKAINKVIN